MLTLSHHTLFAGDVPLLTQVAENISIAKSDLGDDEGSDHCMLRLRLENPIDYAVAPLGHLAAGRFLALHRYEPFWMKPAAGCDPVQIPRETQALVLELSDHRVALFIPLIDGPMRCALEGRPDGLSLVAETGSPAITADACNGLFIATGKTLHDLTTRAAAFLAQHLRVKLRREKPLPVFIDGLGWCTWNAFYQNISHDKIRAGLQSLHAAGIRPQFLILDDGWQSAVTRASCPQSAQHAGTIAIPTPPKEEYALRLTSLAPNEKFSGNLSATTLMAKEQFGIRHVLAWHALTGYWAGIDPQALPKYAATEIPRRFSPGILHYQPDVNSHPFGASAGIIPHTRIHNFFSDYHRLLKSQGIDGVKVDNQAALEAFSIADGRTRFYHLYQRALETSATSVFENANLLNCMSCANDLLYTSDLPLTRTSIDFYPDRPHSHGMHLWTNAAVGTWFGHFIHPDWDMFQSHHPAAEFHAAARALSGGPIYISDPPGAHNADLLHKLTLGDGAILRAAQPATLTSDSLFTDPTREDALLKIWTTTGNAQSPHAGILGLFNCHYIPDVPKHITASARAADIPALPSAARYLLCARGHALNAIRLVAPEESIEITLAQSQHQILTFIPFPDGALAAPIGLPQKFLPSAAITSIVATSDSLRIGLRPGISESDGPFAVGCVAPPIRVRLAGVAVPFHFADGILSLQLTAQSTSLSLHW